MNGCVLPRCYRRFHTLYKYGKEYYHLLDMLKIINKINPIINLYDILLPDVRKYIFKIYLIYCKYSVNKLDPVIHCSCSNFMPKLCHKIEFPEHSIRCKQCYSVYSKECWEKNGSLEYCQSCFEMKENYDYWSSSNDDKDESSDEKNIDL